MLSNLHGLVGGEVPALDLLVARGHKHLRAGGFGCYVYIAKQDIQNNKGKLIKLNPCGEKNDALIKRLIPSMQQVSFPFCSSFLFPLPPAFLLFVPAHFSPTSLPPERCTFLNTYIPLKYLLLDYDYHPYVQIKFILYWSKYN